MRRGVHGIPVGDVLVGVHSAEELRPHLEADPEYQAKIKEREEQIRKRTEACRIAEKPMLEALAREGYRVSTCEELSAYAGDRKAARFLAGFLLGWLLRVDNPWVKWDMVRTLRSFRLRGLGVPLLIKEFRQIEGDPRGGLGAYKNMLSNAIASLSTDDHLADLLELAQDRSHGMTRFLFPDALRRLAGHEPRVARVLESMLDEPQIQISWNAAAALTKLGRKDLRAQLEPYGKRDASIKRIISKWDKEP